MRILGTNQQEQKLELYREDLEQTNRNRNWNDTENTNPNPNPNPNTCMQCMMATVFYFQKQRILVKM